MVALTASDILYNSNSDERVVLYRLRNVDTADTFDCSTLFAEVKCATFVVPGTISTVGTVTFTGTVLTLTNAGMANDTILLTVIGQSSA